MTSTMLSAPRTEPATRYSMLLRAIHWSMAAGFAFLWASGWWMRNHMEPDSALQEAVYDLHKSVGVTLFVLLAVRVAARMLTKVPPLPQSFSPSNRRLAHLGHVGLYAVAALALSTGWALTDFGGHGVVWFGLPMPQVFAVRETLGGIRLDPLVSDMHGWLAYGLLGLVAVHVGAVFWHRRRDHVDLLPRMGVTRSLR